VAKKLKLPDKIFSYLSRNSNTNILYIFAREEYGIKKWAFLKAPKGVFGTFAFFVNTLIPILYIPQKRVEVLINSDLTPGY
jgi:hypothetical protein